MLKICNLVFKRGTCEVNLVGDGDVTLKQSLDRVAELYQCQSLNTARIGRDSSISNR